MSDQTERPEQESNLGEEPSAETAPQGEPGLDPTSEETAAPAAPDSLFGPSALGLAAATPNRTMRMLAGAVSVVAVTLLVLFLLSGSGNTETDGSGEPGGNPDNPFLSKGPPRKTLAGRWVLIISQPDMQKAEFHEISSGLFELTPRRDSKDLAVTIKFQTHVFPDATIDRDATSATATTASIVFTSGQERIDYQGTLRDDGIAYGNVLRGDICLAARLMPTEHDKLDDDIAVMSTLDRPKLDAVMNKAKKQKLKGIAAYQMFCHEHPETSLALDISKNLMLGSDPRQIPVDDFRQAIGEHLVLSKRWGPRMEIVNRLMMAHVAFRNGYPHELALELAAEVDKELGTEPWTAGFRRRLTDLETRVAGARGRIAAEAALEKLAAADTADHEKSLAALRELHKKFPYSHFVTFGLAEVAEKAKRVDEAIELYGRVVALPILERLLEFEWDAGDSRKELPSDSLARLWKQKHGDTKGLPAYIDGVYARLIDDMAAEIKVPRPEAGTGRAVLCEMFTSVRADPAVAGELATAALQKYFGKDRLIVVRYHPLRATSRSDAGGDPLSNEASLNRLVYYRSQEVPLLLFDGLVARNTAGILADTPRIKSQLANIISKRLAEPSDWTVSLTAQLADGTLKVTASAKGTTPTTENHRMRLLLVEERVPMPLSINGIRYQDMIVRSQLDEDGGVEPDEGEFDFKVSITLDDIRGQLTKDLRRFERLQGMNFPKKPMDFKSLYVVGFVQDKSTHEVLQTAVIKVTAAK